MTGGLPKVAGRVPETSIATFEHRCLVQIQEEQRLASPDNALICVLCDAVRLSREYADRQKEDANALLP